MSLHIEQLGNALMLFRHELDLTQAKASERIGCTRQMVGRYESGDDEPTVKTLAKILAAYVRSAGELEFVCNLFESGMGEVEIIKMRHRISQQPDKKTRELVEELVARVAAAHADVTSEHRNRLTTLERHCGIEIHEPAVDSLSVY